MNYTLYLYSDFKLNCLYVHFSGYSSYTQLAPMFNDFAVCVTWEGDNLVMSLQMARYQFYSFLMTILESTRFYLFFVFKIEAFTTFNITTSV